MKKLKVLLLAALATSVLLTGCGKKEEAEDTPNVDNVVEKIPEADTGGEENTDDSETAGTETPPAEGMVRSRLTNEWIDGELANTRPIAVMIPNEKDAVPHFGVSNADILYECNVEGSMTRLMAVINNWQELEKIGNVRSCRDYYVYWSFEWDAIYLHIGGPFYIDEVINRKDTQDLDGNSSDSAAFYRTEDRKKPHNAYTSGKMILDQVKKNDYPLEYREGYADEEHYKFAPESQPNLLTQYSDAIDAEKIDMSPAYPVTKSYFVYNEQTGLYDRFQHLSGTSDGPYIDGANNEQLAFKNILIQNTYFEVRDQKGYLAFQCADTTRDGWFFTNGKGIHVNWEKKSDYGATRYYDDDGNEIQLNTGKTMVCILEDGDSFNVDGSKIGPASSKK